MARKNKKFLVDIDLGMNQMYNVSAPTQSGQVATYEWVTGLIEDETLARLSADDTLDGRINALISNSVLPEIDSFAEVVNVISSEISTELSRATSAELSLDNSVSAEVSSRTSADISLQSNIDVEKSRIDAILSGSSVDLDQFIEVVNFVESIDLENDQSLLNAITQINDNVADGVSALEAADSAIQDELDTLNAYVEEQLVALSDALETEVTDRETAVATIQEELSTFQDTTTSSISSLQIGIDSEIADRIADVNAEESRALAAEAALQSDINAEIADRTAETAAIATRLNQVPVVSAFTIGDGESTSFTLNHELGTTDVMVQIFDNASGSTVETESIRVDAQSIMIKFASAPEVNEYRVISMGIKSFNLPE